MSPGFDFRPIGGTWRWAVLGGQSNGQCLAEVAAKQVADWAILWVVPLLFKQWGGSGGATTKTGVPLLDGDTFLDLPSGAFLVYVPGKGWVWR
jgi:protein gp37